MHAASRTTRFESADVEIRTGCDGYGLAHETIWFKWWRKFTRFVSLRLRLIDDESALDSYSTAS